MSNVKYSKSQREHAKANNVRLYTVSITWQGGKEAVTYQGPCTEEFAKELQQLMAKKFKNGDV